MSKLSVDKVSLIWNIGFIIELHKPDKNHSQAAKKDLFCPKELSSENYEYAHSFSSFLFGCFIIWLLLALHSTQEQNALETKTALNKAVCFCFKEGKYYKHSFQNSYAVWGIAWETI